MILLCCEFVNAQISGQLFQFDSEYPAGKISTNKNTSYTESNFDGYFTIEVPKNNEKFDLIIDLNQGNINDDLRYLKILIKNLKLKSNSKIDLGKLVLPTFKSIEIEEYKNLSKTEKENCYPIYHYTELLGYVYTNELQQNFLILNCQKKIIDFTFDKNNKTIKIDWKIIKDCN